MNRNARGLIIAAVVILVIGGWFVFASHKAGAPASSPSPSLAASPSPSMSMKMSESPSPSSSAAATATDTVKIQNYAFSPANITVKKGTTVTWTNEDSVGHTVTESDGQTGPASPTIQQGKTYSFTFNTVGTFHYKCTIHPYMTGTVAVTD
jgi:plastocyanin